MVTGELLYNLQVVALDSEGAEVIVLKVAGDPKVGQGAMLKLEGLVALPWTMGDRSGVVVPREPDRVDRCRARRDWAARVGEGRGLTLGPWGWRRAMLGRRMKVVVRRAASSAVARRRRDAPA